ncbi:XAC2610-related protein [Aquimarina algiphila]|uniref:XAC2610-related protein n=1 Tax=Aquimarina algiphila TaxID=2047982 RepID=UPI00232C7507|nr:hypothetical protein [Aquimarina algiphila]
MKRNLLLILITSILITIGCKKESSKALESEPSLTPDIIEPNLETLRIEGNNIWIRDVPKKGKVVLKLNDGDRCILIDTSKIDTVKGYIDYWYQVKYKDTIGWVFGSQTSIKSENSKETSQFLKQNRKRLQCDSMDYTLTYNGYYLSNMIIHSGTTVIDTIHFKEKTISAIEKGWGFITKEDFNFDNLCDFIIYDEATISHGSADHYYLLYDVLTKKFKMEKSLPKRIGGFEIDKANKQIKVICPYGDCEGYWKFIDNTFKLVKGEFYVEP